MNERIEQPAHEWPDVVGTTPGAAERKSASPAVPGAAPTAAEREYEWFTVPGAAPTAAEPEYATAKVPEAEPTEAEHECASFDVPGAAPTAAGREFESFDVPGAEPAGREAAGTVVAHSEARDSEPSCGNRRQKNVPSPRMRAVRWGLLPQHPPDARHDHVRGSEPWLVRRWPDIVNRPFRTARICGLWRSWGRVPTARLADASLAVGYDSPGRFAACGLRSGHVERCEIELAARGLRSDYIGRCGFWLRGLWAPLPPRHI